MKGIILYLDNYEPLRPLTYDQKGRLLDAIFLYMLGEELPQMDAVTKMAFEFIRTHLDAASEKYEDVRRKRAEAGKRHKGNQYTLNGTNGTSVPKMEQMEQDGTNGTNGTNTITNTNTKTITKTKTMTNNTATVTDGTSVPNYADRLKGDDIMLAAICSATAMGKEQLLALLPAFENQLCIDGKRHTNYTEYRKHFQMYASKKAEIERQQQLKSQSNGEFRTSAERRRGKTYDLSQIKPEDYHESF